ncbi:hypothetical protein [Herbaspirillum huttiense]|uniref:Uncharacterized protein n=1 Tax=Herbaspirillum huttiense subsp. lycopersici TaxID=3074428 RepID=A0ABU2EFW2_9BURK|nr:hypothetical protein [Herbaspirillum huttiense]MDR9847016.1 hypothetical protein [Herbaspirillum huttiense SE1]
MDFGFFFCRVVHFYSMSPFEVMELPLRTFWLLQDNIDRIEAQRDMRSLTVGLHQQSGEAAIALRQRLTVELGSVVKTDMPLAATAPPEAAMRPEVAARYTERDEVGFAELKAMAL